MLLALALLPHTYERGSGRVCFVSGPGGSTMKSVAGIFTTRDAAERGVAALDELGVPRDRVSFLTPGASTREVRAVPTQDAEQPGTGTAIGAVVGGAVGAAGGFPIGAALVSLAVPGVGPVIASGILGAALLGVGGAAVGATLEDSVTTGLPKDELFLYEDALREGRSVVIALAADDDSAEAVRAALERAGAESVDAARERWWVGLRPVEAARYEGDGRDFARDEAIFRRGFEAALHRDLRGRPFDEALDELRGRYPDVLGGPAFRDGYERGQLYLRECERRSETPPLRRSA